LRQKGLDFGDQAARPAARKEPAPAPARRALTVSQLTERIQSVLETELVDFWVEGEVSNVSTPASGHVYFSLKDERAQIRAVIWKSDLRYVRFRPRDGQKVVARGQLRVYPAKGEYQVQVQLLEPLGKGALQQAFEELKQKLEQEGLFDPARKRALPLLPRRIGVVSSPTGAVIQDIVRVLRSRHPGVSLLLYPARVQGEGAAAEIVKGVRVLNQVGGIDVLIVARGGGSLEDLWPFNEETVARALAASSVPTLSAVGHETDYTIADFVADARAPTPSAAAERAVPAKRELENRIRALEQRLGSAVDRRLQRIRARVEAVTSHRVFAAERGRIRNHAQWVDGLVHRSGRGLAQQLERARQGLGRRAERLRAFRFERQIGERRARVARCGELLESRVRAELEARRGALERLFGLLDSLSPLAVLARGYALVWDESGRKLLRRAHEVSVGDPLRVRLHEGALRATVVSKE
jgi:exodeoxyribonuclease VII large subunit